MRFPFKLGFARKKNHYPGPTHNFDLPNLESLDNKEGISSIWVSTVPKDSILSLEPSHAFGARFAANNTSQVTAATTNETTFKQAQSSQILNTDGGRLANDLEFEKPSQSIEQPAKVSTGKKLKAAILSYTESARKAILKKKDEEHLANTNPMNFASENFAKSQISGDFIAGDDSGEDASAQREREVGSATSAQSQAPRSHETRSSRASKKGPYTKRKKTGTSRKLRILAAKKRRAKRRTTRSGKLLSRVPKNLEAWEDIKQNVKQPEDEGYDLKFDYNKILKPSFVDGWLNDTVNPLVDALPLSAGQLAQGQIKYAVDFDNDLEEPARECAHCKRDPSGASGLGNCDTCYYFMKSERTEFLKYGDAKNVKREFDAHASCPFMSSDVEDSFASTGDSMLGICLMPILGVWDKVDRKLFQAKTRFRQFTESVPVWSQNVRAAANSGYGWRSLRPTKCGPQPKNWGDLLPQDFSPRYDEFWPQDLGPADFYKVSVDFSPKPAAPRLVQVHQSEPATSKKPESIRNEAKQSFEVGKNFFDAVNDTPVSGLKVSSSSNDETVSLSPAVGEIVPEQDQYSVEIEDAFKSKSRHQISSFSNGNSGFDFYSGAFATGNPNDEWAAAEVVSAFEHSAPRTDETAITPLEKVDVEFSSDAILKVSPELSTAITESAGNSAIDNEFKVLVPASEVDAEIAESVVTQLNSTESIEQPEASNLVSSTLFEERFIDTDQMGCTNISSSDVSVFEPMEPVRQPLEACSSGRAEDMFEAFFDFTETKCASPESTIGRSTPVISEVPTLQLPETQSLRTENLSDLVSQGTLRSNADVIREIDEMLRGLGYDSTINSGSDSVVTEPCSPLVLSSPTKWDLGVENELAVNSQVLTSEDEEVLEEIYTRKSDNKGNPQSIENLTEALVAEIMDQYNKGKFDQPGDPNAAAEILSALLDEVFRGAQGLSEEFINRHKEDFVEAKSENFCSSSDHDDSHRFTVLSDSDEERSFSDDSERELSGEEPIDFGYDPESRVPVLRELRLVRKSIAPKEFGKECQVVSFTRSNSACQDFENNQPILRQLRLATRSSGVLTSSNLFAPLTILGLVVETDFTTNESSPKLQPVICVPKSCPKFVRRTESVKIVSSRFNEVGFASHVQSTLTKQKLLPTFHEPYHTTFNEPEVTDNSIHEQMHVKGCQEFEATEEASKDRDICKGIETTLDDGQPKQEESLWVSLSMDQDFDRNLIGGSDCVEEDVDILRTAKENMPRMTDLFRMAVDIANLEASLETREKSKAKVQFKNDEDISETQAFYKNTAPSDVSRSKETLKNTTESLLRNSASNVKDNNPLVKGFSQPHTEEEVNDTEMELWAKIDECKESLSKQIGDSENFEVQNSFVQFLEAFKLSREHFAELATSQVFEYSNWLIQIKSAISAAFALTNGAGNQYMVLLEFIDQEMKSEKSMRQLDSDIRVAFETLGKISDMLDQIQSAILSLRFEFPDYVGIMAKIFGIAVRSCDELLQIYAKFCLVNVNETFDTESIHYCTGYKIFLEKTEFLESNRDTDYEFKFATYLNQLQKSHDVVNTAKTELERRLQIISMNLANNRFLLESNKRFENRLSQETIFSKSDLSLSGKTLTGSTEDVSVTNSEIKTEKTKAKKKMVVPGWMKFKGFGKKH